MRLDLELNSLSLKKNIMISSDSIVYI